MAYLDDTGLAYFWGKLKAWANSVFALLGHTHPASDVTLMTGYSKPASGSAIAASDTLNQAVGKLEAKADAALDDSSYVHRTGAETVAGMKTFTGPLSDRPRSAGIVIRNMALSRGNVPEAIVYNSLILADADHSEWNESGVHGRFGTIESYVNLSNSVGIQIVAYQNVYPSNVSAALSVTCSASGNAYATAPSTLTPDVRSAGIDIVTRDFIPKDTRIVHTSGEETIDGTKTFSSTILFSNYYAMRRDVADSNLILTGGVSTSLPSGGKLILYGSSASSNAGYGVLQGGNSLGYRSVEVQPSIIYLNTDIVDFPNSSTYSGIQLRGNRTTGGFAIFSGVQNFDGAGLLLFGRSDSSCAGQFFLRASTKSSSSSSSGTVRGLTGTPNGSIYWNGQAIQTSSDERLKRDFASVDDAVLDGWGLVDWLQFRFRDAVEEKGERARLHVGLVAQRVDDVLLDAGVDVKRYGIVCHEHSESRTVRNLVTDAAAYTDEEGVFHEAVTHCDEEFVPGVDEWTVRYAEALCMEAAYMRRENARLKKRVADLEERLAALEFKIA